MDVGIQLVYPALITESFGKIFGVLGGIHQVVVNRANRQNKEVGTLRSIFHFDIRGNLSVNNYFQAIFSQNQRDFIPVSVRVIARIPLRCRQILFVEFGAFHFYTIHAEFEVFGLEAFIM